MTNKQILKKAIEKAYKGGWGKGVDDQKLSWTIAHDVRFMDYQYWYSIIFSHSFAKAFWGEESIYDEVGMPQEKNGIFPEYTTYNAGLWWKVHLQQMVLEEQPLKYLEKFL